MIYPWQQEQWAQINRAIKNKRLPHALLLAGIAGMGKFQFAETIARKLLCARAADDAPSKDCACHACNLITGKSHPNMLWVAPEKEGQAIKIDAIREVSEFILQTSLQGTYRIVLIHPANKMNANAANALLKTLEEPSPHALIILVSDQDSHLPATIISRCQRIVFHNPTPAIAAAWLKQQELDANINVELLLNLANGAPLAALQLIENDLLTLRQTVFKTLLQLKQKKIDPISSYNCVHELDPNSFFDLAISWVADIMRFKLTGESIVVVNNDFLDGITTLANQLSMQNTAKYLDFLQHCRQHLMAGMNLNKQLLVESALIRWVECA